MRLVQYIFVVFFLVLCCWALPFDGHAAPAAVSLESLIKERDGLIADKAKADRRDNWLKLEKKFAELHKKSSAKQAPLTAFHLALCREELAYRSHSAQDYSSAQKLYADLAKKYPKSPQAPEAMLHRAEISYKRLKNFDDAEKTARALLKSYPSAPEAAKAKKILDSIARQAQSETSSRSASRNNAGNSLTGIRWEGGAERGVLTLHLQKAAAYQYEYLPADPAKKLPARIRLELPKTTAGPSVRKSSQYKQSLLSKVDILAQDQSLSVILEVPGLVCYAVSSSAEQPERIVVEVSKQKDIKRSSAITVASGTSAAPPARTAAAASGARSTPGSKVTLMEQLGLNIKTIMIDPGHGGKDPGTIGAGVTEKNFTLKFARLVGGMLQKKGFTVLYTRTGDTFVSLDDRPQLANEKKADLLVSIHLNANTDSSINGLETYYLNTAINNSSAKVAARENAVNVKNISDLQFILADFMLSAKLEESRELARTVQRSILARAKSGKYSMSDNGVRSAPFYVLMGARMPAILLECGYITSTTDAALLKNDKFLRLQAEGLVNGIMAYRDKLTKYTKKP